MVFQPSPPRPAPVPPRSSPRRFDGRSQGQSAAEALCSDTRSLAAAPFSRVRRLSFFCL